MVQAPDSDHEIDLLTAFGEPGPDAAACATVGEVSRPRGRIAALEAHITDDQTFNIRDGSGGKPLNAFLALKRRTGAKHELLRGETETAKIYNSITPGFTAWYVQVCIPWMPCMLCIAWTQPSMQNAFGMQSMFNVANIARNVSLQSPKR